MNQYNYDVQIKYWNLLMAPQVSAYPFPEYAGEVFKDGETLQFLFYSMLADEYNDPDTQKRILALFQGQMPFFKFYDANFYRAFIEENKNFILDIMKTELDKMDMHNVILFGITSKFYQWIPGILLAKEFKKRNPHIKVILGGLSNKQQAVAVMNLCPEFDFTHWGEGEYSLLELCKQVEANTSDYEQIPRLVYRTGENGQSKVSETTAGQYLDLGQNLYPDYSEYFETVEDKIQQDKIVIQVDGIRGCSWNRCNFCIMNRGYKYREKTPGDIVQEIEHYTDTYGVNHFFFTDNNIVGRSAAQFERRLDLLIDSASKRQNTYVLGGSLIPSGLHSGLIKKMKDAGFDNVQFGYEALTDALLKKMNKSNCFSDNLFMVKSGLKNSLKIWGIFLIRGVPNETEADVIESIDNLHYLRFFLSENKFAHEFWELGLWNGTNYHSMVSEEQRTKYTENFAVYFMPRAFPREDSHFNLFYYVKRLEYHYLWQQAEAVEKYYRENKTHYRLFMDGSSLCYEEYHNDQCTNSLRFDSSLYLELLKKINDKVCTFDELLSELASKHPGVSDVKLREILAELKAHYLVYYDESGSNIISILDVDGV